MRAVCRDARARASTLAAAGATSTNTPGTHDVPAVARQYRDRNHTEHLHHVLELAVRRLGVGKQGGKAPEHHQSAAPSVGAMGKRSRGKEGRGGAPRCTRRTVDRREQGKRERSRPSTHRGPRPAVHQHPRAPLPGRLGRAQRQAAAQERHQPQQASASRPTWPVPPARYLAPPGR